MQGDGRAVIGIDHGHSYDDATGEPFECPIAGCWFGRQGATWRHVGCGGAVVFDLSGGFCTRCHAENLEPGGYYQGEPA